MQRNFRTASYQHLKEFKYVAISDCFSFFHLPLQMQYDHNPFFMEKCLAQQTELQQGSEIMTVLIFIFAVTFKKQHPVMQRSAMLP